MVAKLSSSHTRRKYFENCDILFMVTNIFTIKHSLAHLHTIVQYVLLKESLDHSVMPFPDLYHNHCYDSQDEQNQES